MSFALSRKYQFSTAKKNVYVDLLALKVNRETQRRNEGMNRRKKIVPNHQNRIYTIGFVVA